MDWVQEFVDLEVQFVANLLASVLILIGLGLLRWWLLALVRRRVQSNRARYSWRKVSTYVYYVLAIIWVGALWVEDVRSLGTYLGLLSAGLAIALKDPLTNLIGWAFILWRRPFAIGDRIQIGEKAGDVVDLGLFRFTLLEIGNWVDADQSTGRVLHIPNGMIFVDVVANYTQGFDYLWHEIPIVITFESNWRKAKEILQAIVDAHSETVDQSVLSGSDRDMIDYKVTSPIVYTSLADQGVVLTMRYLCKTRMRRDSANQIYEEILDQFDAHHDIHLAYPTHRITINPDERPRD